MPGLVHYVMIAQVRIDPNRYAHEVLLCELYVWVQTETSRAPERAQMAIASANTTRGTVHGRHMNSVYFRKNKIGLC